MAIDDIFGGMAQGAGTGAGIGMMTGTPQGALLGAGLGALGGGLLGGIQGYKRDKAKSKYNKQMDSALAQLNASRQQAWQQRMGDLDQIMSFYGPAVAEAQRLTGAQFNMPTFSGRQFGGGAAAPAAPAMAPTAQPGSKEALAALFGGRR